MFIAITMAEVFFYAAQNLGKIPVFPVMNLQNFALLGVKPEGETKGIRKLGAHGLEPWTSALSGPRSNQTELCARTS